MNSKLKLISASLVIVGATVAVSGCGGGGGGGGATAGDGSGAGNGGNSGGSVDLSSYRLDANDNLFLNRNNADEVAAIVLKELMIQGQGVSGKGLGTPFDLGELQGDTETFGITHYLVRALEFSSANFPNTAQNSPFCELGGPSQLSVVVTDENQSSSFNNGDSVNALSCSAGGLAFFGGYGIANLQITGVAGANSDYSLSGNFFASGVETQGSDFLISNNESGSITIVGESSNRKIVTFTGAYDTDYATGTTGNFNRVAGSSHQSRSLTVNYTPMGSYSISGSYNLIGNFDAMFNETNSSFRFGVESLTISGSSIDGQILDGVFVVTGAGDTQIEFEVRNDGTLVFAVDENGDGTNDFSSGALVTSEILNSFRF